MDDTQFLWYMACQWILAMATIFLGVVAIWGHIIRNKWFGPRLRIDLKNAKGAISQFNDGVVSRYYHLRVWNKRRAAPAHNVRVVIRSLLRPGADGIMVPSALSGPLQLMWQFQASHPQFQTIGAESTCDFGYLRKEENFKLSTLYHQISFDPFIQKGQRAVVCLVALSDECESNELRIEVAWDGIWSDDSDEMLRHMVVKKQTDGVL